MLKKLSNLLSYHWIQHQNFMWSFLICIFDLNLACFRTKTFSKAIQWRPQPVYATSRHDDHHGILQLSLSLNILIENYFGYDNDSLFFSDFPISLGFVLLKIYLNTSTNHFLICVIVPCNSAHYVSCQTPDQAFSKI